MLRVFPSSVGSSTLCCLKHGSCPNMTSKCNILKHLRETFLYSTMSKSTKKSTHQPSNISKPIPSETHINRHPAFSRIIDAATSVFDHQPRPSSPSGCGSGGARLPLEEEEKPTRRGGLIHGRKTIASNLSKSTLLGKLTFCSNGKWDPD